MCQNILRSCFFCLLVPPWRAQIFFFSLHENPFSTSDQLFFCLEFKSHMKVKKQIIQGQNIYVIIIIIFFFLSCVSPVGQWKKYFSVTENFLRVIIFFFGAVGQRKICIFLLLKICSFFIYFFSFFALQCEEREEKNNKRFLIT